MIILTAIILLKRRLLKIAKLPVLSTGENNNSKSRYVNDLKFVMTFYLVDYRYTYLDINCK